MLGKYNIHKPYIWANFTARWEKTQMLVKGKGSVPKNAQESIRLGKCRIICPEYMDP